MTLPLLLFFLLIGILVRVVVRDRIAFTFISIYLGWWGLCLVVSSLDLLGMNPVSSFTYFLLLLNVSMFTAGYLWLGPAPAEPEQVVDYRPLAESFQRHLEQNRVIRGGLVLLLLYLAYYFIRYQALVSQLGPAEARNIRFYTAGGLGSTGELLLFNFIIEAVAIYLVIIVTYSIILGSVRNWIFVLSAVNFVLYASIGAGRTSMVQAGLFLVFLAIIRHVIQPDPGTQVEADTPVRKKILPYLLVASTLLVSYSIYLTATRMFSEEITWDVFAYAGEEFSKHVLSYSTGPFRALDYAIQHPSTYGYHFGRLTFGALDEVIGWPMRMLGVDYQIMNHFMGEITQQPIIIGNEELNALYTCVFKFYFDFGVIGVIVFPFLFGVGVRKAIALFDARPCFSTFSVMLFCLGVAFFSTQIWFIAAPASLVFLLIAYLLYNLEMPCEAPA